MSEPVASLDIFDTVLTRRVGAPRAVFYFVGCAAREQGLVALSPEAFAAARSAAQKAARQRVATREVTLEQISAELAAQLALPPEKAAALSALELAVEAQFICAVPGVHPWLAHVRMRSPRVIFASDMYLSADFLRARLIEHGCWQDGDGLYVSNEHGGGKLTGALFQAILAREKISTSALHHTGNHADADFAAPKKLGLRATHRAHANLNRYEDTLETFSIATSGLASLHAGASRLARLAHPAATPIAESIRAVGAGVAGPVLSSYVRWVLTTARRRGIVRLYFVARDGFIPLQLAKQFAPQLYPEVELRYLHGSRQAWHLPGIFSFGPSELDALFADAAFLSVASLCERVDLRPAEISGALTSARFPADGRHRNLSPRERIALRELFADSALTPIIEQRAATARELLLAYLQQESLLTPDHCALVDIGWHGRAQDSLAKVIRSVGFPAPEGFYFGLNSTSGLDLGERHAWFFDRRAGAKSPDVFPGIEPLLETFCTADHGATIGYRRTAQGIEPVLRAAPTALRTWGWPTFQATLAAYRLALVAAPAVTADEDAVRAMCHAVLQQFWQAPTPLEAAAWGAFPYEDAQSAATTQPLAAALPWHQFGQILLHGRHGPHRAAWWHGGLQLTPRFRRSLLAAADRVRTVARAGKRTASRNQR